jgi:hypothetical protein
MSEKGKLRGRTTGNTGSGKSCLREYLCYIYPTQLACPITLLARQHCV